MNNVIIYIALMILTTYIIRVVPLVLIKKPIKNKFIRSFLYYVPYVTLTVMTFPAIVTATSSPIAGMFALFFGVLAAWKGLNMVCCAGICSATVFILSFII